MPGTLWIASSALLCVYPDGTERHTTARLSSPTRRADGRWVSAYAVDGVADAREMVGTDSLQALSMAMSMVRGLLEQFIAQGGQVLDPDDRIEFPIEATFGLVQTPQETLLVTSDELPVTS